MSSARPRVQGIDVARGLASLIMIQGHAYDAWVRPEDKTSAAYLFTRVLGSLPLPAFLVLAGAAIALRVEAAERRAEPAVSVRRSVFARGCSVLAWGYAASLAYALIDGTEGWGTLLRADVLHAIGISIALLAWLGIRGAGPPTLRAFGRAALGLAIVPVLVCPWLSPVGASVDGPLKYAVALFVDVPGVTRMPVVPLAGWLGLGACVVVAMRTRARGEDPFAAVAGARAGWLVRLLIGALAIAIAGHLGTRAWVDAGAELSRAHPIVWLNAIDLGARGVIVLAVGALVSVRLPASARRLLVQLGRASLFTYVLHLPLTYGRLAAPLWGTLSMPAATAAVGGLLALCALAVLARDYVFQLSSKLAARRRDPRPST
ncbi:MAG: heparan-alpha-glucosaminide N-acetyltransferase domain-containing protein [Sandaracinaceae bacterium]